LRSSAAAKESFGAPEELNFTPAPAGLIRRWPLGCRSISGFSMPISKTPRSSSTTRLPASSSFFTASKTASIMLRTFCSFGSPRRWATSPTRFQLPIAGAPVRESLPNPGIPMSREPSRPAFTDPASEFTKLELRSSLTDIEELSDFDSSISLISPI
jgi:hypothetical protein